MGDNRGQTIAWLIGRIDGIEKLLQKIAPKYRLMDGDILTLPDAAVAAQRTVAEPSRPRDWASLPAIQRTAGEMPLVAAPGRFVQRLPGSAGLPPIVQPLGHEVSPLASAGLVVARARAVEAPAPAAIPAPVQRRASRGAQAAEGDAPAFDGGASAPAEAVVPDGPVAPVAPAATATPIRTMPTVSRQAVRLPERPLTSAAVAARPVPVQRATAAAAADSVAALPRPSGGMRRVPSAASAAPGAPVVSREVAHPHLTATPALAAAPPAATPSTRRGLGEPMQSAPTTARPVASVLPGPVVSRSTTSGPMPIAVSNLRPVTQRSAEGGPAIMRALGSGPSGSGTDPGAASAMPELLLPHLPAQRSTGLSGTYPTASPAEASPAMGASGPEIRPIAGANPIRPSIEIQRASSNDLDDQPPDDELPSPWWSPAAGPASDPARSNADSHGLGGATATSLSASVQRSAAGSATPTSITTIQPRGSDWGRPVQAGRSAPVAAPVQRIAGSALRPSALPQPVGVGGRHGATGATSVVESSSVAPAPSSGRVIGGPVVQTSPAGSSSPAASASTASSFGSPAMVQREEASAPAAPARGGSGLPSERDLDELAQALFGRIRGRLRNDLIYDREAKGLTFDNV